MRYSSGHFFVRDLQSFAGHLRSRGGVLQRSLENVSAFKLVDQDR